RHRGRRGDRGLRAVRGRGLAVDAARGGRGRGAAAPARAGARGDPFGRGRAHELGRRRGGPLRRPAGQPGDRYLAAARLGARAVRELVGRHAGDLGLPDVLRLEGEAVTATLVLDPFEQEMTLAEEPRVLSFAARSFE